MTDISLVLPTDSAQPAPRQEATLLFVDDEPNILSALRRLFRPLGYRILIAEGGAAALSLLEREAVDLVISDMRMPEMDGAQLLEQVKLRWPQVIRLLLTGYADIQSTVSAINQGEIHRYVSKPWNDRELTAMVADALERRRLAGENARLSDLTQKQNEELKTLNASLEARVAARTAELSQTMAFLELANDQLKKNMFTVVRVLSGLTEMRGGVVAGHSRRVAEVARQVASQMGLDGAATHEILLASLLHDIGKVGFPDRVLEKPFNSLTQEERALVVKHPVQGALALMEIEPLRGLAQVIRHHHECYDGSGYPDRLRGDAIPLGARILAVANDYDALQVGTLVSRRLNPVEARAFMQDNKGKRYDPVVMDAFELAMVAVQKKEKPKEHILRVGQLLPGMVLSQDLLNPEGYLLLPKGVVLTPVMLEELRKLERTLPKAEQTRPMLVHVMPASAAAPASAAKH